MADSKPRFQRRKEARPSEILEAAAEVFLERGFAAAKLEDIARRAGLSKGSLYVYFETKEDLFQAVAKDLLSTNIDAVEGTLAAYEGPFAELLPALLARAAAILGDPRTAGLLRMVLSESKNFPELARIWHDHVAQRMVRALTGLIRRAQQRGELRQGDPQLYALSIVGPLVLATLVRQLFGALDGTSPDLAALAAQHAETVLHGLLAPAPRTSKRR